MRSKSILGTRSLIGAFSLFEGWYQGNEGSKEGYIVGGRRAERYSLSCWERRSHESALITFCRFDETSLQLGIMCIQIGLLCRVDFFHYRGSMKETPVSLPEWQAPCGAERQSSALGSLRFCDCS